MDSGNVALKVIGYILMTISIIPLILYIKYHGKPEE